MAFTVVSKKYINFGSEKGTLFAVTGESSYAQPTSWTKAMMGIINAPTLVQVSQFVSSASQLTLIGYYDAVNNGIHFYVVGSQGASTPASSASTGEVNSGQNLSTYSGTILVLGS